MGLAVVRGGGLVQTGGCLSSYFIKQNGGVRLPDTDYQRALDYIYSFIDYERVPRPRDPVHYDLRRMDELLGRLGNPHLKARTVHIAGTKGKGSVAAMIASVLTASGYTTGLFTSPHLHVFNERIRVDDRLISEEELVAIVEKVKPAVTAVNEKATYGRITTFELTTALGFVFFEIKGADFQVIEVGLGGRLDATNIVRPEVCVITSISRDHTEVLGEDLAGIAAEKAGIIKSDSPVVTAPQVGEVDAVIEKVCQSTGSKLVRVGSDVTWQSPGFDSGRQALRVTGRLGNYDVSIPLLGQHQLINAAVAVAALEVLAEKGYSISPENIAVGLEKVNWPGRLQVLNRRPLVVVDGAHNPESARLLKQSLEQYFDFEKAILILGLSADKDIAGIVGELLPLFDEVIATHSIHPRALATAPILAEFSRRGLEIKETADISIALPLALDMAGDKDLICVTGSLFVVAGAIEQAEALGLTA